jgi:hypothetical protein
MDAAVHGTSEGPSSPLADSGSVDGADSAAASLSEDAGALPHDAGQPSPDKDAALEAPDSGNDAGLVLHHMESQFTVEPVGALGMADPGWQNVQFEWRADHDLIWNPVGSESRPYEARSEHIEASLSGGPDDLFDACVDLITREGHADISLVPSINGIQYGFYVSLTERPTPTAPILWCWLEIEAQGTHDQANVLSYPFAAAGTFHLDVSIGDRFIASIHARGWVSIDQ